MLSTFPQSLQREIDYLNRAITTPLNGNAYPYLMRRIEKLQNEINNLYKFANKKDGRVKNFMVSKLDTIQFELDSIVNAIKYR